MSVTKEKVNWDKLDIGIEYTGRAITLPAEPGQMPLLKAKEALERKIKDEDQKFQVHELFDAYPTDAAVAMVKAMTKLYGWASPQTEHTWFGPQPPTMLSVKTGVRDGDVVQCPLGLFKLPGVDEMIKTLIHPNFGFVIAGEVKKRDRHIILELATETRRLLKAESIYRGKPIKLCVDDEGDLITGTPPEFMDVTNISEVDLIFDPEVQEQINTNLLVPLRHTAACRKHKIPLKRGVGLEGPFGTGKSLLARLTAHIAEENGWTFVLLDKVQGLRQALEFANKYSPAVVFAEDIDRIMEERTDGANDLINTIDGVISKKAEIMVVLTTNFIHKIDPVILRPGRLDAIISLRPPTAPTCERLIRHYAGKLLPVDAVLTDVGEELSGQIPASIRECVERAKLGMIGRNDDKLSQQDIVVAAKSMKCHLALLNSKPAEPTNAEKLATSLRSVLNGHDDTLDAISNTIENTYYRTGPVEKTFQLVREIHSIIKN